MSSTRWSLVVALFVPLMWACSSPQPTPNAQMQAVLDELAALGGKPIETLTPAEARLQPSPADAVKSLLTKQGKSVAPEPVEQVTDAMADGVPIRIYKPAGEAPFPVIFYVHGGGWVLATIDTYDSSARALANAAHAIVVSTHYRQAPEHKFPSSHDDVYTAYQWTSLNIHTQGGDPARMAVAGESAGGNMALDVAMRARDAERISPVALLLVYPVAGTSMRTPSYTQNAQAKPLNAAMMAWFFQHELATPEQAKEPRLNVVDLPAQRFKTLPPVTIVTADIDPLRSDGEMLAEKLRGASNLVTLRNFEGVTHEFFGMGAVVDQAKAAVQFATQNMSQYFGEDPK